MNALGFVAVFYAGTAFVLLGVLAIQLVVKDVRVPRQDARLPSFKGQLSPAILSLGLSTFTMAVAFSMPVALETSFDQRLHGTALSFGVAFSALMISRLILQVPLGRRSDRVGRKRFIVAGLVAMTVATVPIGWVMTNWQLILLRVGQGIGSAAIAAPVFALAADLTHTGNEGRQMSIVAMGFGLGVGLGSLIAGAASAVSFQLAFIIGGTLTATAAALVYRFVPRDAREPG